MTSLIEIRDSYLNKLTTLRNFYMSSLIENEFANNLITKTSTEGNQIESKYKSEENMFIFGQGSSSLNTKVKVDECIDMITKSTDRTSMLINLLTINLCSTYESFLFDLLEFYLRNFPDHISNSQKNMKLQEVFKYTSINEIREDLITREIMDYGFLPLEKQLSSLEKNYKVNFNFSTETRIAKRILLKRNCIVHNQGLVNKELYELFLDEQKTRNNIGKTIITTEFEFSEEIHLLNLMGTRIITTLQNNV